MNNLDIVVMPDEWMLVPGDVPSWRRQVKDGQGLWRIVMIWRDDFEGVWKATVRSTARGDAQDVVKAGQTPLAVAAAFELLDPMKGFTAREVKQSALGAAMGRAATQWVAAQLAKRPDV